MTTWMQPVRHPWFDMPSSKRKHYTVEDEDNEAYHPLTDTPTAKRRRCSSLENGFAHLTLQNLQPQSNAPTIPLAISEMPASETVMNDPAVIHPTTIEEPPEVKMKGTSWYEPQKDRIVITDLDDSDDESSDKESSNITISSALLERIKFRPSIPPKPSQAENMALVLFKPSPIDLALGSFQKDQPRMQKVMPDDAMDVDS